MGGEPRHYRADGVGHHLITSATSNPGREPNSTIKAHYGHCLAYRKNTHGETSLTSFRMEDVGLGNTSERRCRLIVVQLLPSIPTGRIAFGVVADRTQFRPVVVLDSVAPLIPKPTNYVAYAERRPSTLFKAREELRGACTGRSESDREEAVPRRRRAVVGIPNGSRFDAVAGSLNGSYVTVITVVTANRGNVFHQKRPGAQSEDVIKKAIQQRMVVVLGSPTLLVNCCPGATRGATDDDVCLTWDARDAQVGLDEVADFTVAVNCSGDCFVVYTRYREARVAKTKGQPTDA